MPTKTKADRPLWTEDFSVHAAEDKFILRRQFSKFLVLTSFGMLAGNIWIWMKSLFAKPAGSFPEVAIAKPSKIGVGDVKLFNYPTANDPCILVRIPSGTLAAYSQKCTHLSCAIYYSREQNRFECPCHEGFFSVENGSVLQGPPPRPLPKVVVEERGGRLYAIRVIENRERS